MEKFLLMKRILLGLLVSSHLILNAPSALGAPPAVPTGLTLVASSSAEYLQGTIRATWNVNSEVDGYTVYLRRAGQVNDQEFKTISQASNAEWTFTNLVGGSAYSVQVIAIKAGEASARSAAVTVTPITKPEAPSKPSVVAGIKSATVTWVAVPAANNGGSPITSYVVTEVNSKKQSIASAEDTRREVTDLSPGAVVEFTISAINSAGATGSTSLRSEAITLANVPAAPTNVVASTVESGKKLVVTWNLPVDRGSALTSQKIYLSRNGNEVARDLAANLVTTTISDLATGEYRVQVVGVNPVGEGVRSALSAPVSVEGAAIISESGSSAGS